MTEVKNVLNLNYISKLKHMLFNHPSDRYNAIIMHLASLFQLIFDFELWRAAVISSLLL